MALFERSTLPNAITVARIALTPVVYLLLFIPTFTARFAAFIVFLVPPVRRPAAPAHAGRAAPAGRRPAPRAAARHPRPGAARHAAPLLCGAWRRWHRGRRIRQAEGGFSEHLHWHDHLLVCAAERG